MEVVALDAVEQAGNRCGGTLAAVAQPAFDLIEAVVTHLGGCVGRHLAEGGTVKPIGAAEGQEELFALVLRLVAAGEAVEHLGQTNGEQLIGMEALLVAQQVQLHQQLIHQAAVERRDDMGKGLVKRPLAIGNGEARTHAETSIKITRP